MPSPNFCASAFSRRLVALCLAAWFGAAELLAAGTNGPAGGTERGKDWAREQDFWSFRPPVAAVPPAVRQRDWVRQPVDTFVLQRLERAGLAPSGEAGRAAFLRRVTFDLTGLPPAPGELAAFLASVAPDAVEQVVDRLLASPRFGERLASWWLPLARYAEDQAHQVGTDTKYFYPNAWRYRDWIIGAFNRDLPYDQFVRLQLAADRLEGTNSPNLAALGFLGLGPKYYNRDRLDVQADEWEDRVDTVSRGLLGLTVACARCHDHKFDPVTMQDYYGMAGVFASTRMVNRRPDGRPEKTDAQETNLLSGTLHVVADSDAPQDLPVFLRGNVERKGPVAPRRFLRVLSREEPSVFRSGSGRAELAACIADPENPLTARVWVNRVWGHLFGRPLVPTPSNFGRSGQPPSHPELLDDLAVRFMERGWSVKRLVRELVLSATYRQAAAGVAESAAAARAREVDPANELWWHMPVRRLGIEQWRDAVLAVTGELSFESGRSLELDDPRNRRRTVQARISRLKLNDVLMQFDYPDANVHAERRGTTTTALQKLFLLNSDFVQDRARVLVARLGDAGPAGDAARMDQIYQLLFARLPDPEERRLGAGFLARPAAGTVPRWVQYAQLLLMSNEMLYID